MVHVRDTAAAMCFLLSADASKVNGAFNVDRNRTIISCDHSRKSSPISGDRLKSNGMVTLITVPTDVV
jgi:hypothetical protein